MIRSEEKRIIEVVDETVRLYFENPTWTFDKAIETAKELIKI